MALKKWVWKESAEVLGILGVIASLILVATEVSQNTAAVRGETIQGVLEQAISVSMIPAQDSDLREAIYARPEDLTDDQRNQLYWFFSGLVRLQMLRFYHSQEGSVDESTLLATAGSGRAYNLPTFHDYWQSRRVDFPADFREFMEENFVDLSP